MSSAHKYSDNDADDKQEAAPQENDHFPTYQEAIFQENDQATPQENDHLTTFQANDHFSKTLTTKKPPYKRMIIFQPFKKKTSFTKMMIILPTKPPQESMIIFLDEILNLAALDTIIYNQAKYINCTNGIDVKINKKMRLDSLRNELDTFEKLWRADKPPSIFETSNTSLNCLRRELDGFKKLWHATNTTPLFKEDTAIHHEEFVDLDIIDDLDLELLISSLLHDHQQAITDIETLSLKPNQDDFSAASMEQDAMFVPQDAPSSGASPAINHCCNHITNEMMKLYNGDFKNERGYYYDTNDPNFTKHHHQYKNNKKEGSGILFSDIFSNFVISN